MSGAAEFAYRIGAAARETANWVQLLKFGLVGASGYVINLAVFALLSGYLDLYHLIAAIGAFAVAVTSNFLWNGTGPSVRARDPPTSRPPASSPSASPRSASTWPCSRSWSPPAASGS
jgi:hypothetical protein